MILEDIIPCIRLVYEYDSTYRELFHHDIISKKAEIFKVTGDCSYLIFPYGIYEKIDRHYLIVRLGCKRHIMMNNQLNIERSEPYYMSVQYITHRETWMKKKKQCIESYHGTFIGYITPYLFQLIYDFNFRTRGLP